MRFTSSTIRLALVISIATTAASAGCGDDETQAASATTQSSGTGPGASSSSGAGAAGGAGGSGGSSGTQGGGGSMCQGDQAAWDAIEKMDIPCQANSDCCVVVNGCTGEAQIVGAADSAAAAAAWPSCTSDCVDCQPAMIGVECLTTKCVGHFPDPDPTKPPEVGTNHCGQDGVTPTGGMPKTHFTCSG